MNKIAEKISNPKYSFGLGVGLIAMGIVNLIAGNLIVGTFLIVLGVVL